ncbi:hypothetical protein RE0327_36510 [Prescottella equi]|nr:hypothetical protein RE0327_36510 [Prescottella equi]
MARETIGTRVQVCVREGGAGVLERDRVGGAGDLLVEQRCECCGRSGRRGGRRVAEHLGGVREQCVQQPGQSPGLGGLEQPGCHGRQHDRDERIDAEHAAHRGIEVLDLLLQPGVRDGGVADGQRDPVGIDLDHTGEKPGQVLDRQRVDSGLLGRHVLVLPDI